MKRPIISAHAELDLFEIVLYIARDNEPAAMRFAEKLNAKFQQLAEFPEIGVLREDLGERLRSYAVGNFVIFYRPVRKTIEVVRILSGARNIEPLFDSLES